MDYMLPAATYQPPSRPVRGTMLNTIIEDYREGSFAHPQSESGTDTDEGTVIYNPVGINAKADPADPKSKISLSRLSEKPPSPLAIDAARQRRYSFDELYDASDNETEFSDSSSSLRDSVSSRPTSFATESTRNSAASSRSGTKHRHPAITIPPSHMWPSLTAPKKKSPAVPPTPPPKVPVSPAALSLLPRFVPAINAPPSLDGSSMTSEQVSCMSAPVTPEVQNLRESESWDVQHAVRLRRDRESAQDDSESESTSPHAEVVIEQPIDWDEIGSFPHIPGATPQETSPIMPDIRGLGALRPASPSEKGVLLPSDALRTLSHLAPDRNIDTHSESSAGDQAEMRESLAPMARPRSADAATPASLMSEYSFSQLSVPSPGGFFSSLNTGTRHTWYSGASKQSNPPSSTTAENFYNVPWHQPRDVVEQVIEVEESNTDGPSTARQHFVDTPSTARRENTGNFLRSATYTECSPIVPTFVETGKGISRSPQLLYEYEDAYEEELMQTAAAHMDRTSTWLAAQMSYLAALRETNPANDMNESSPSKTETVNERKNLPQSPVKKMVRFLEQTNQTSADSTGQLSQHEEPAYYHAFQHLAHHGKRRDGFVHSPARFDAVQASRVAFMSQHVDQLCGKYEIREPTRPKYAGPLSQNPRATGVVEYTPEQMAFMGVEREQSVLDQILPTYWITEALKYLNGGNLLVSNATARLAKADLPIDDPRCVGKKRIRALDLGGNTSCDWAWHCARQFPNVKTYTVTTPSAVTNPSITGPSNHRLIVAPQLWKLPFKDSQFDVISARSLHSMLKREPVPGHNAIDEYDLCLQECYRVLKPGGFLEFMLMDSDMTHAGPLADAMSVEFGFKLKTRGYDPSPTKSFLGRLRKANFIDVKRAWMLLPAGTPAQGSHMPSATSQPILPLAGGVEAEHGPVGSTADIANISGLLGSWMWEQWMLKLQTETGTESEKLLKGVAGVLEESRNCEAGWRCLNGWARKPKSRSKPKQGGKAGRRTRAPATETIHIKIEE